MREEQRTRRDPVSQALNIRAYTIAEYSPVRGPRPPRWPATNSHFLFQDRGKNRIIPSWSVLLGYLLVWMISLNAMLREHVSDRSIGKRNDSMTISALLFSRRFRSFGCVIYVLRTIFSFFFSSSSSFKVSKA